MREKLFSITIKDFEVQTYRGSGPGGQHRNKTDSAVRLVHKESGAASSSEVHKSQHQNKKEAFRKVVKSAKFQKWMRLEASRKTGALAVIEQQVDKEMKKVRVETKNSDGQWEINK